MANSQYLDILLAATDQVDLWDTINDMESALEKAGNKVLEIAMDPDFPDEYIVDTDDFVGNFVLKFTSAVGATNIYLPSEVNGSSTNRVMAILNESDQTLHIVSTDETLDETGAVIDIEASGKALIVVFADNVIQINSGSEGGGGGTTTEFPFWFSGMPPTNQYIWRHTFVGDVDMGSLFVGSYGSIYSNPTATLTLNIQRKRGASTSFLGTISINTSGVVTFTGSGVSFQAGDIMQVYNPNTQDATAYGIAVTFKAT